VAKELRRASVECDPSCRMAAAILGVRCEYETCLGPRRYRYRPPLLPPALSLVQPALYLPVSILVLLTPARNSASLPGPPPPRLPPTATMTPMTSEASTPRWTRYRKTTGRGPPSPRSRRPHRPQQRGVQNTAPCCSRDHAAAL
jgi:hypothetical protein